LAWPITSPLSLPPHKNPIRVRAKSFPLGKIALGKWLAMYKNVKDRIVRINDRYRGERELVHRKK